MANFPTHLKAKPQTMFSNIVEFTTMILHSLSTNFPQRQKQSDPFTLLITTLAVFQEGNHGRSSLQGLDHAIKSNMGLRADHWRTPHQKSVHRPRLVRWKPWLETSTIRWVMHIVNSFSPSYGKDPNSSGVVRIRLESFRLMSVLWLET